MKKLKIYMGWDKRETVAYDVARRSILKRTSLPKTTQIVPLQLEHLNDYLTRPIEIKDGRMWCPISEAPMATEFAISRFCVPFLQKKGWALFVDCDIVCLADIAELFALADEKYAVMVVKHQHTPRNAVKMDNQIQTSYARKNWSSVVLWNCDHPANKRLTLEKLNFSPGRDLHAFNWLKDDEIGELNYGWNCLVGIDDPDAVRVGILHYTLGGPWIEGWAGGPMDDVWNAEAKNE